MKNKILLVVLAFSTFLSLRAGVEKTKNSFLDHQELKNASVGYFVKNINTGEILLSNNSKTSIIPASILKLVTTATAIELFGADTAFKTILAYDGEISYSGELHGNIYILGYGDPALGSAFFISHYDYPSDLLSKWVDSIKMAGITKINGSLIGIPVKFGRGTIPDKWLWEDIANYYGAVPSGLNYRDNEYFIHFKTGNQEGAETEIIKVVPDDTGLSFDNRVKSASSGGDRAYIYINPNNEKYNRIIKGTLPWKRSDFRIRGSLPNPELYIAQTLTKKLEEQGITVLNDALIKEVPDNISQFSTICTTFSPPLSEIIRITNQRSFNLYAEALGLHISEHKGMNFEKAVKDFWKDKITDTAGFFITDASGLSPNNAANPEHFVSLLEYMHNTSKNSVVFKNSLAVSGLENTTLVRTFTHRSLRGKIKAKSGSMTRVIAYAGYIEKDENTTIAFCIIINNYAGTPSKMRSLIEDWLLNIMSG